MSSKPRAGEKRRSNGHNDGDSAVPVKVEALGPASSSRSAMGSRSSLPEPNSKTGDVTPLFTAAEVHAQIEQKVKQCAAVYEAKILKLASNHATEKAQLLMKAVQGNERHGEETARLHAEIESLEAKLKAMHEADAAAASVKKEAVSVVDEQAIRHEMEQRFAEERQNTEQRFVEEKQDIERSFDQAKQKAEQEIASTRKLLASTSEAITSLTKHELMDSERTFAQAMQKAEQEIATMTKQLASKSEEIKALTNKVLELTANANKAESEKIEARQHSWEYYAQIEALEKEVDALRAASRAVAAPSAPNVTAALPSPSQIYVGKLMPGMAEDTLGQYFSRSGHVTRVVIARHPSPGVPGYAFVYFSTPAEAQHALAWTAHSINGQDVVVGPVRR